MHEFSEDAVVKLFPQKGGWFYLALPKIYTEMTKEFANRGLVPVTIMIGQTTWQSSLLPMGNGTLFIALNYKVRKRENLKKGDRVRVLFSLR